MLRSGSMQTQSRKDGMGNLLEFCTTKGYFGLISVTRRCKDEDLGGLKFSIGLKDFWGGCF